MGVDFGSAGFRVVEVAPGQHVYPPDPRGGGERVEVASGEPAGGVFGDHAVRMVVPGQVAPGSWIPRWQTRSSDAVPDRHLCHFPHPGPWGAHRAVGTPPGLEGHDAGCQLRLLRLVGLAVSDPHLAVDRGGLPGRSSSQGLWFAHPAATAAGSEPGHQPGDARVLQVRRLLRRVVRESDGRPRAGGVSSAAGNHPPGGYQLLHLPDDVLFDRHLPRTA